MGHGNLLGKLALIGLTWHLRTPTVSAQDTIPFILTAYNNIVVPAVFNGTDTLRLMFHSSFTGVSVTQDGLKRCSTMRANAEGVAHSWGGDAKSSLSSDNVLRIGGSLWDSSTVTVDEQSGQGSDGKFGYDLFADKVLEINYDSREFIVHGSIPEQTKEYSSLPLKDIDGSLYVEASITLVDSSYTDQFMLHTGYGGTCILGTGFMARVDGPFQLDTLGVKELSDSFGNVLKNVTTRTPRLLLGDHMFSDVRIQVMDRRSQFEASVLGNDLLRRFDTLIDLRNGRLYLKPNRSMGEAFSERF